MVTDICKGTFKGFALLRQLITPQRAAPGQQPFNLAPSAAQQRPVYAPGYGLIPPSQVRGQGFSRRVLDSSEQRGRAASPRKGAATRG